MILLNSLGRATVSDYIFIFLVQFYKMNLKFTLVVFVQDWRS